MTKPSIYVGTYAKYNNGSIAGAWVNIEGMDKDDFYDRCAELHSDETDPEYMFQDYEGFPEAYYGESGMDDKLWDWLELDEDDREILAAYQEVVGASYDIDIEKAREAYQGQMSEEDFTAQLVEDTCELNEFAQRYFDYDKFQRDLFMSDYISVEYNDETYIFRNE